MTPFLISFMIGFFIYKLLSLYFIILAGFPPTMAPSGTFELTTLPAAITA